MLFREKISNRIKIKTLIIICFAALVTITFLLNFYIIKVFLFQDFRAELLDRWYNRTMSIKAELENSIMLKNAEETTLLMFDQKNARKETAYFFILDSEGELFASTFINVIPEHLFGLNLPAENNSGRFELININGRQVYDLAVKLNYGQGIFRAGYYKEAIDNVMERAVFALIFSQLIPLIAALLLAFWFSDLILQPVRTLIKGVRGISRGELSQRIEVLAGDEIGELAEAFNKMTSDLKRSREEIDSYNLSLQEKIEKKTAELQKALNDMKADKNELESQRTAILNILEDAEDSRKQLEETNLELGRKKFELETLNALGDELIGIFNIEEALKIIMRHLDQVLDYHAATFLVFDPLKDGKIIYKAFLKQPIASAHLESIKTQLANFLSYYDNPGVKKATGAINNAQPEIIGSKIDNRVKIDSLATFIFPLNFGEKIIGALHVASANPDFYLRKEEKDFFRAMVSAFSIAAARMQVHNQMQQLQMESLVKSLVDGLVMFDNEQNIILANPAIINLWKKNPPPDKLEDIFKVFDSIALDQQVKKALTDRKNVRIDEVEHESRFYEVFITPVIDHNKQIMGGAITFHDITHMKEIDIMKTEFVSVASHQLRTPLTAIKLFTEMLLREDVGKITKNQREYLENVFQSTERMVRLVNDLLSLSRLESGRLKIEPSRFDLKEMVEDIFEEMKPLAESNGCRVNFITEKTKKYPITIDQDLIRQVVNNLLANAIKYSVSKDARVDMKLEISGSDYLITVKDNGIGIEKFFRADNAVKFVTDGTGLGLHVCKMIIDNLGGKIWFESEPGKGSSFFVSLPVKGYVKREGKKGLPKIWTQLS